MAPPKAAAPIYLACSSFELPETCRSSTAPYDILEAVSALAANDRSSANAAIRGWMLLRLLSTNTSQSKNSSNAAIQTLEAI
jgi:hypothetical protein